MTLVQFRSLLLFSVALVSFTLIFTGCEKKVTNKEQPAQTVDTSKGKQESTTDIKGKYTGTFDRKSATLNITDQTASTFKGNLTVNYRKALNQDIEGEFDSKTMEFNMKDVNPGKFQGTYKGKFSDNFSKLEGTFTLNSKGGSYTFNLKKK